MNYDEFLKSKVISAPESGFDVAPEMMNQNLFEWQRDIVRWSLKKGKAALFEDCGLGKTIQQLEFADKVSKRENKPVLIVAPLAVADQTRREGKRFGYEVTVCRTQKDVQDGINITNYEMLEHFDSSVFGGVVLDESSILKNYSGTIRTQIIEMFRQTPYKLSCTATPAPNDYMELGNQAEFLGVMSRTEMLSTFFVHDGGETSKWRLKGHAEQDFWKWLATWAVVLTSPADLGYPADGYNLPEKITTEHTVSSEQETAVGENVSMFTVTAKTLTERREARRDSLEARCQKAADLITEKPDEQWLIWCDLNDESGTLARMIENSVEVRGSDSPDYKARMLNGFTVGEVKWAPSDPMRQAQRVKQLWYRFTFEGSQTYIAIDAWQYGTAVLQAMMMDLGDGLAPLCVWNHEMFTELELPGAVPVIYPIRAGGVGVKDPDSEMLRYAILQFENNNVQLLTSNYNEARDRREAQHKEMVEAIFRGAFTEVYGEDGEDGNPDTTEPI